MDVFCDTKHKKLPHTQIECDARKACDMSLWPCKGPPGVAGQQGPRHIGGVWNFKRSDHLPSRLLGAFAELCYRGVRDPF